MGQSPLQDQVILAFHHSLAKVRPSDEKEILRHIDGYYVHACIHFRKLGELVGLGIKSILALPAEGIFYVGDMQKDHLSPIVRGREIPPIKIHCLKIRSYLLRKGRGRA